LSLCLAEVAELVSGVLDRGDAKSCISGVQALAHADASQASFLANKKYKSDLLRTHAAVVFLAQDFELTTPHDFAVIRVKDPYVSFALLQCFFHPPQTSTAIQHDSAVVDTSASIADHVQIDAHVSMGQGVSVGSGSIIGAGCVLADGVKIGRDCHLHPRVVLEAGTQLGDRVIIQAGTVIGSDGFGYAWTGQAYLKIPQVGRVVIEDDVDIGANTCIDRGAIGDTVIRRGAKLDNLIQIAHNVDIGECSAIAGQSGFAGSTVIGKGCQFGAQSGVAGHLKLTDGTIVGAKAGVIGDIKEKGMVSGFPAVPHRHWLKASALFDRLPAIWNKIKRLG